MTDGTKSSAAVGGGLVLTVSAATASKLVFTSTAVTITAGAASGNLTVQRQDQFGNPVTTEGTRTVVLSSSSTGTVTFNPASLSIASSSSSGNFTYTDSKAGTPTMTAASSSPSTIASATQVATITKAGTAATVSSSSNPSGFGSSVSFTATLPANATGNVIFSSTNGAFSTNTVSGVTTTSLSITNLPRGTNVITAAYLGDGNYTGSTNTLNQIVTNHPPVASAASYTRNATVNQIKIAITNLLSNVTDLDGDTLTLAAVSATTNAATLIISGDWVLYDNTHAVTDQFTYTVSDGFGGTNSATVTINVDSMPLFGQATIPAVNTTSGAVTLNFAGIPTYSYSVQRSINLTSWTTIWTTNAPASGAFQFIDASAPQPSAYYRLQYNP